MSRTLNKWVTATFAIMALTVTLGFAAGVDSAEARAWYAKFDGVDGSSKQKSKPQIMPGYTGRTVCCYLPRKNLLGILTPVQCRKLKGTFVPLKKCAQAGAKASDAYFVKVDSETTTQNSRDTKGRKTLRK